MCARARRHGHVDMRMCMRMCMCKVTVGQPEGEKWPFGGTAGAIEAYGGSHVPNDIRLIVIRLIVIRLIVIRLIVIRLIVIRLIGSRVPCDYKTA